MALTLETTQDLTAYVVVDFDRIIASGGYGDVYKGSLTREVDGHSGEVAVKVTRFIFANVPKKVLKSIKQELDIWQRHRHPYILPLIGVYLYQDVPCAVSPWCNSGTIIQYMKSARAGHEPELDAPVTDCDFDLLRLHCLEIKLLSEVTEGLAYLHELNIAHGDIKASNILVKGGVAQLGDFGFSIFLVEHSGNTSSHLGTTRWFAPESLQEHAHRTQEADMWAFGCVILEVRTLIVPYHRVPDAVVPLAIVKGRPFERPNDIHSSLWIMAEACWSRSPKARIASPTLASSLKTTLKYATLLRQALGALPDIRLLGFGYPNSNSTARFSVTSVIWKKDGDGDKSLDLTLAVAAARNALYTREALRKRYRPTALEPIIRLIAITSPQLAEQLTVKLRGSPCPELGSPLRGHTYAVYCVSFLQDGRHLVSSSGDTTLRLWDIRTGETVIGPLKVHARTVLCVAVHGSRIASCSYDGTFRVGDTESDKLVLGPITAHSGKYVRCVTYSKDGKCIATAGDDNRTAVWDADTGVRLHEMAGHTRPVLCVAFSVDGTRLVSGSQDETVNIWNVVSGESCGEPFTEHSGGVTAVCFSPDGKRVFSSSDDHTIRIWNVETRALLVEPLRMNGMVLCMALSPDGRRLVSGSHSRRIAMWDAETGAAIPTSFREHEGPVLSLAFSPDGRMIASASWDRTIVLWDATDD